MAINVTEDSLIYIKDKINELYKATIFLGEQRVEIIDKGENCLAVYIDEIENKVKNLKLDMENAKARGDIRNFEKYENSLNDIVFAEKKILKICEDYTNVSKVVKTKLIELINRYNQIESTADNVLSELITILRKSNNSIGINNSNNYPNANVGHKYIPIPKMRQNPVVPLKKTREKWKRDKDGGFIFDSPQKTGAQLDARQGKYPGYGSTCGLVSCVNVLNIAGVKTSETEIVPFAAKYNLCFPGGGTTPYSRSEVLASFGAENEIWRSSISNIVTAISHGKCVIISVHAQRLVNPNAPLSNKDLHAITVTSVKLDKNHKVVGFYVCDSGGYNPGKCQYYPIEIIKKALTDRPINVTDIVR